MTDEDYSYGDGELTSAEPVEYRVDPDSPTHIAMKVDDDLWADLMPRFGSISGYLHDADVAGWGVLKLDRAAEEAVAHNIGIKHRFRIGGDSVTEILGDLGTAEESQR